MTNLETLETLDRMAPSALAEVVDRYADGTSTETDARLLRGMADDILADIARRRNAPCATCDVAARSASDHLDWCPYS